MNFVKMHKKYNQMEYYQMGETLCMPRSSLPWPTVPPKNKTPYKANTGQIRAITLNRIKGRRDARRFRMPPPPFSCQQWRWSPRGFRNAKMICATKSSDNLLDGERSTDGGQGGPGRERTGDAPASGLDAPRSPVLLHGEPPLQPPLRG